MNSEQKSWFGVRCIFVDRTNRPWGPRDLSPGEFAYDERITLWYASSLDEAIELAEAEAEEHADILESEYTGLAQAYRFDGDPGPGTEVFSLIRRSRLDPSEYLDRHFDTGTEYQQGAGRSDV